MAARIYLYESALILSPLFAHGHGQIRSIFCQQCLCHFALRESLFQGTLLLGHLTAVCALA
jgi:hypothetical protein